MLSKECKLHLEEVGETGLQHMCHAFKAAARLQLLVPVLLIHGLAPRLFKNTASDVMKDILTDRENDK